MKYNYDEVINRKGTNSVKWDLAKNDHILPMWVADMDFKTAPEIIEALSNKVSEGVFGYSLIPDQFYDAVMQWWKTQYHFTIEKEWLLPIPGMILSLSAIVRTFMNSGENIILQPPVYNHFFTIAEYCGFNILENNLHYKNGNYEMDFEDLEEKASHPKTTMLLLSNPHNPVGKVWTRQDLKKIAEICSRNHVMVISDEIHADLVFKDYQHIPFASVAHDYDLLSVSCGSPCKTFNLSGLTVSYIICQNLEVLDTMKKTLDMQETSYPNPLALEALIAAYTKGQNWMDELKEYVYENYLYLKEFCDKNLPEIKVIPLQATYLVWLDCSYLQKKSDEMAKILLDEEKLWLNSGRMYGNAGEGFLRMNIACPRELLIDGLQRLQRMHEKLN